MTAADQALEIANLKARYCAAADLAATDHDGAHAAMMALFVGDFTGDYGFGPLTGPQAIADFLCGAIAQSEWMLHMIHSPRIAVDGDAATGDWTVMAMMKRRETGETDTVLGRYSDAFRLTPQGWRIARLTFTRMG